MATYSPAKRATAWVGYISLVSQADTKLLKSSPTIAAGDFQVSKDGGALANLTTLPAVTPAASAMVKIDLSATEMTADNVTVVCIDAAGAEWCGFSFNLQPSARQIDDLAYPATSGRSIVVDANGLVDALMVKAGATGAGTAITARDIGASVLLSAGTGTGQLDFTSGVVKANATQWLGGTIPAVNVTGVPLVDAKYLLGTIFSTPTVAGIPNVNAKTWNDLTTVALPLVPTTAGRTLDVTAANKVNGVVLVDTLTTYTGNTVQTGDSFARIGVAGAGLTNIDLPNQTMDIVGNITGNLIGTVSTLTTYTGNTPQTGDSFARIGVAGAGLTNIDLPNQTMDITGNITGNLSGSVGSVTGAVGSVTGNVGGNVVGTVASVVGAVGSVTGLTASNLDATISSRASAATLATVATYIDTEVAAIKAVTDLLPDAGALTSLATQASVNIIDDFLDTEIAAIKAKTDNLPASPAAVGSAMTLTAAYDLAKTASQAGDAMTLTGAAVDAILDDAVDGSVTWRQSIRLQNAVLAGDWALALGVVTYRDLANTKDRLVASVSAAARDVTATDVT